MNLSVSEIIAVSDVYVPGVVALVSHESISTVDVYAPGKVPLVSHESISIVDSFERAISGFQMPLSRPQGNLAYDYQGGGSPAPQTGFSASGGL